MENVPQIVSQRLKAAPPAVNHPDADVLTAFSEMSLPERERAQVLDHLARCVDCRDVVALALPASESVEPIVSPSRSGWLTWPTLRWGFAAAGVIVIASLGLLQYQRHLQPGMMAQKSPQAAVKVAKNEPLPAPAAAAAEKGSKLQVPAAPAFTDTLDANVANEKKSMARAETQPPRELPAAAGASPQTSQHLVAGSLPHGPRLANQWQQTTALQNQAPVPAAPQAFRKEQGAALSADAAPPAVSETVQVASAAPQPEAQTEDSQQLQNLPAPSASQGQIARAKPVVTSAPSQSMRGAALAVSVPIPQWAINSGGGLQRSFDQGNTWQAVDVTATSAYSQGATSLEVTAKTARAKSKDEDNAVKRDAASITFRAVAASGSDVWAGGSAGALYHSVDAGNHWTHVVPTASGSALTGDILSLDFPDVQHGRISTSNGEVWTTSDAGQAWQKH